MKTALAALLLAGTAVAAEPKAHKDIPYTDPKTEKPEKDPPKKRSDKEKKDTPATQYGTVRFAVSPYATVECGDLKLGEVPPADRKLPVGTYSCVLTNPDTNQRHTEVVKVEANTTTKVQYKFTP